MTSGPRKPSKLNCTALHNAKNPHIIRVNEPQSRGQTSIKENAVQALQARKAHSTHPIFLATQCNRLSDARKASNWRFGMRHGLATPGLSCPFK